ncbi:transposable element Tc1 transposase [Trichonephila clavipes]|nr:transposable element Tc1 transposase [Trichonephila clavipes]
MPYPKESPIYPIFVANFCVVDESRFHLCPDDHRRHVCRRPGQRAPILLSLLQATQALNYPGLIFQQDNIKPHTTRIAMNRLTAYQTLPWPARSPDPSPIEHVWDMMGRRLHLPENVNDLARQLDKFGNTAGDHQGAL